MRWSWNEDWPEFTALRDEINRMFEGFARRPRAMPAEWAPPVDILETPETLLVRLEVPGVEAKSLDISVTGDTLTIRGEKPGRVVEKDKAFRRREILAGPFTRTVSLPVPIEAEKITAVDRMGVLEIMLPKKAEARIRRIPVKVE